MQETSDPNAANRVLHPYHRPSENFFFSDLMLGHFLENHASAQGMAFMTPRLNNLGKAAALRMDALSLAADKQGPELIKRNWLGEPLNEIRFHPAYHELTKIAVDSGMFQVKWQPGLREKFSAEAHLLGFAAGYLFSMAEGGLYCPLCMTDGVARLLDRHASPEDKQRLLPRIWVEDAQELYTGAMFLTEKAGGSDVGANMVSATPLEGSRYLLNGEKWFCSNANAEIIFALARTNPDVSGTKGLSIFLLEPRLPDGSLNGLDMVRLKDKLGVRSMASAEIVLRNAQATLVGQEGEGFKIMADMINLSRLYNSISAISLSRRALIEAYTFLTYRKSFGKEALDHALIRTKLAELAALQIANFYMTMRAVQLLDRADGGDEAAGHLLRLLTPMVKKESAERGVYIVRESMELMGGMGYIEDGVMPKLMRDTMVLPIWEGAGNIMVLDMLRASGKSEGLALMLQEITTLAAQAGAHKAAMAQALEEVQAVAGEIFATDNREVLEATAKPLYEQLTVLYQMACLLHYNDDESEDWIDPALDVLANKLLRPGLQAQRPLPRSIVEDMVAWRMN